MNLLKHATSALTAGFVTLGVAIYLSSPAIANQTVTLSPGFGTAPTLIGQSGGERETTDCGFVKPDNTPDYVVTLTEPFNFLRATVKAEGDVTMLVMGPKGRICSDDVHGLMPELSGPAPAGTYSIWIGDYSAPGSGGFRYEMTISTEKVGSAEQESAVTQARGRSR
jgi:hypothetical protein